MATEWQRYDDLHPPGHTVVGDLRVLAGVDAPGIAPRDLLVLLPAGATVPKSARAATAARRYPVVYMLDGQNLFDDRTSFTGEWQVDETLAELAHEGIQAIVVGIPNGNEHRFPEYTPWATSFLRHRVHTGAGHEHLAFITDVVRPLVDASFPTRPGRESTAIIGSSLGGLMAAFAGAARPDVFGLVGAVSPALGFGQGRRLLATIRRSPAPVRAYVDTGDAELAGRTRSAAWVRSALQLRDAWARRGLREGVNLRMVVEPGGIHHESAWARRLPDALRFLLG